MSLKDKLAGMKAPAQPEPLWKGPEVDGVTQSLLGRYLVCKERFRIHTIEGLRPVEDFNHRIEYGNMWHVCEEAFASERAHFGEEVGTALWEENLLEYGKKLIKTYPMKKVEINKWYNCCKVQFPLYRKYWAQQPDVKNRTPLLQEVSFKVPYKLPSGRSVLLRGKWDSVDLIDGGIWLQENKTKSEIDETGLVRQLTFDLQSMFYLIALAQKQDSDFWNRANKSWRGLPIAGVRYNVIRRPLSGGKGTIKQLGPAKARPQGETEAEYYERLRGILEECPHEYFARWKVEVHPTEIKRFENQCLIPMLENLLDDYEWWLYCEESGFREQYNYNKRGDLFGKHRNRHFRYPYGVYNPIDETGWSDIDAYLNTGNTAGLRRAETLFPELE